MKTLVRRLLPVALLALLATGPALASPPIDFEERLHEAVGLQEAGNHDGATVIYQSLLAADPDNPRVLAGLAFACYAKADWEGAVRYAERIVAQGEDCPPGVYLVIGSAYGMMGLWDKAEEILLLGQAVWPKDDALRFHRAINVFAQGRTSDAIYELERCIRQSPYRPDYWRALGDALNEDGARGRAFTAYARAMTLDENPESSRLLAQRMWRMLFEGTPRGLDESGTAVEAAEAEGFSLIQFIRGDPEFRGKPDAVFFSYALDTVLRLVDRLHAEGNQELFWGPFVLSYFDDMRKAGHMEALAMDIRRAAQDPDALRWRSRNPDKLARFRNSSERWAVNWETATSR